MCWISCTRMTHFESNFFRKVVAAYSACAAYLQKKLPLNNELLQSISCLDPVIRQHHETVKGLKKLKQLMPANLADEDYDQNVHK